MTYAILHKNGNYLDRIAMRPTEKEANAFVKAKKDAHLKMCREFVSPLGMRRVRKSLRSAYVVQKMTGGKA